MSVWRRSGHWSYCAVPLLASALGVACARGTGSAESATESGGSPGASSSGGRTGSGGSSSGGASASGGAAGQVNEPPIEACEDAVGSGENPLVDDFEDGDDLTLAVDGRDGIAYPYDDASGGTLTLGVDDIDGGRDESTRALHTAGSGFEDWGAGVAIDLHPESTDAGGVTHYCRYDASVYEGLHFWARGHEGAAGASLPVRVKLTMPAVIPISDGGVCDPADGICYDDHGVDLWLDDSWHEYTLPFAEFTQAGWGQGVGAFNPAQIWAIQFTTAQFVDFDYWIDDIGFYPQKP